MAEWKIVLHPEEFVALSRELANHPDVWSLLDTCPADDWSQRIGKVAEYCGIVVDGWYQPKEMLNLAQLLTKKLYEKRTNIVLLN